MTGGEETRGSAGELVGDCGGGRTEELYDTSGAGEPGNWMEPVLMVTMRWEGDRMGEDHPTGHQKCF